MFSRFSLENSKVLVPNIFIFQYFFEALLKMIFICIWVDYCSICYNTDNWLLMSKYSKNFIKAGVKLRQTAFDLWMEFATKIGLCKFFLQLFHLKHLSMVLSALTVWFWMVVVVVVGGGDFTWYLKSTHKFNKVLENMMSSVMHEIIYLST